MTKKFLLTDGFYYNNYEEQYTTDQIQKILNLNKTWEFVGYLLIPL